LIVQNLYSIRNKEAMPNTIAWTQIGFVSGNLTIQCGHSAYNPINHFWSYPTRPEHFLEGVALEFGLQRDKSETTTEGIVNHRQRPISRIHQA
jgi:hypothetical protein